MEELIEEFWQDPKSKSERLDALARRLVERAVKEGTKDNTTVMIIELKRNG